MGPIICGEKYGSASWRRPDWKRVCTLPAGHQPEYHGQWPLGQPHPAPECPHDTVDESWIQPRRWRRITLYREWCLDCNAHRRREFKRFRWGRWSQWA